ncbi:carbohydrate ABC transporter permease [Acuticoccus sp. M5D2P5]|uniref:carbohydrate ABC transporter permease n=1 Tax=Acuticoccus kalidii TaxID=2910977 RepID=UPI001F365A64|nr:carbohydrate ABC transporter permease [Acuticoccus kalidii]MCF3934859.1 carbohydrate ABC transporter permease [Acuticoccus kalidii]
MSATAPSEGFGLRGSTLTLIGIALVGLYLFPVYWMYISAFKTSSEIFADPPTMFPENGTLSSFVWIFTQEHVGRYLRNSLIIAVSTMALTIVLGSLGAYAMSRIRSRAVDVALVTVVVLQTFPEALLATPMFVIFRELGLLNTHLAVVLATTTKTLGFALVFLRPIFAQVPFALEEAAFIDGASRLQSFRLVVFPMVRVGVLVVAALTFVMAYGEFVYPLTLLTRAELQPAPVGIYQFVGAEYADWHRVMAFASVFVTPVLLIFLLLQRRIVSGLTSGALK